MKLFRCLVVAGAVLGSWLWAAEPTVGDYEGINIYRFPLPAKQTRPVVVPTTPEEPTFIELPYKVEDWMGRGFSTNVETAGADFHLRLRKGDRRLGITPLIVRAHRVLHVIMEGDRTLTLEFLPAVSRDTAFRAIVFYDAVSDVQRVEQSVQQARQEVTTITREDSLPESRYVAATAASQLGLVRFMELVMNMPADKAARAVSLNSALEMRVFAENGAEAQATSDYALVPRFAIRDSVTSSLGLAVLVRNLTRKRLLFDSNEWLVRAGAAVYPVGASYGMVSFNGEIAPGGEAVAFLVLTRSPDGSPIRLLPDQKFRITAKLVGATVDNPVFSVDTDPKGN
jgi:hypothetical protein